MLMEFEAKVHYHEEPRRQEWLGAIDIQEEEDPNKQKTPITKKINILVKT